MVSVHMRGPTGGVDGYRHNTYGGEHNKSAKNLNTHMHVHPHISNLKLEKCGYDATWENPRPCE